MKSAVETLNPTRVRLTVEVAFDELKPSLDAAYKKIGENVTVPGFRKGKVPARIIDQRYGRAAVLDEALNDAVGRFYGKAVEEAKIHVLSQPEVDVTEFADGAELKFTAEVDVRPEIALPEYKGVEVVVDAAEVTDEEIEEALGHLRERFATLVGVDREAQADDHVSIDLSGKTKEGQDIDDAQAAGLSYVVGSASLVEGLDDALVGMKVEEAKVFASTLVAGPRAGEEVDIEVKLNTVKVRELPELDDEFAQTASPFDTVEELRADMRTRMGEQKKLAQGGDARDKVLEALMAQVEIPLPENFLHQEVHFRQDSIAQQLKAAGLTLEDYLKHEGQTPEEFHSELENRSAEAMRAQFLLDAIAKAEEVTVNQEELTRHLIARSQGSGLNPDQFAQQIVQAGQAGMLVAEVVRSKALAVVLKDAKVTDSAGAVVDLAALRPEGAEEIEDLVREQMETLHGAGVDPSEPIATATDEDDADTSAASAEIPEAPEDKYPPVAAGRSLGSWPATALSVVLCSLPGPSERVDGPTRRQRLRALAPPGNSSAAGVWGYPSGPMAPPACRSCQFRRYGGAGDVRLRAVRPAPKAKWGPAPGGGSVDCVRFPVT
ncbi:MAG: trigger factor [Sporichthyaceae bacterium]